MLPTLVIRCTYEGQTAPSGGYCGFQIISASALVARGCDGRRSMGDGIFKASLSNPVRQSGLWLQLGGRSQVPGLRHSQHIPEFKKKKEKRKQKKRKKKKKFFLSAARN